MSSVKQLSTISVANIPNIGMDIQLSSLKKYIDDISVTSLLKGMFEPARHPHQQSPGQSRDEGQHARPASHHLHNHGRHLDFRQRTEQAHHSADAEGNQERRRSNQPGKRPEQVHQQATGAQPRLHSADEPSENHRASTPSYFERY